MEAIAALQSAYANNSDSDDSNKSDHEIEQTSEEELLHLKPLSSKSETGLALANLKSNPEVITKVSSQHITVLQYQCRV